jgi:hypothetical protein
MYADGIQMTYKSYANVSFISPALLMLDVALGKCPAADR